MRNDACEGRAHRADGNGTSRPLHPAGSRIDIEVDHHEDGGVLEVLVGDSRHLEGIGICLVLVAVHRSAVAAFESGGECRVPGLGRTALHILEHSGAAFL